MHYCYIYSDYLGIKALQLLLSRMITSHMLQTLTLEEFCHFYRESVICQQTELIIGRVVYEQFKNNQRILKYSLEHISVNYHIPIMESLKTRLHVSSIYIDNNHLYVDWSLDAPVCNLYVPCN